MYQYLIGRGESYVSLRQQQSQMTSILKVRSKPKRQTTTTTTTTTENSIRKTDSSDRILLIVSTHQKGFEDSL